MPPFERSPLEIVLFLVLTLTSFGLFGLRFRRVFLNIWRSKKDAHFQLQPVAKRVWDFFSEVICQSKVIKERPLPGLAHALVFWGFCAFAIVTIDHFLNPLGVDWLRFDEGVFGPLYFGLAFLFAFAVAVSITGLAIRRFVVRPRWLGDKVSMESGFIAFLIFTLMATFIADYVYRDHGVTGRTLWWLHTLALLTFLPLIPHTKHLHLMLSPFAVFLSRGKFASIPPLSGDEDFGLDTGKDVTQLVALQAYSCVECGRCSEHCPATNTGKVLNPKYIALGFRNYLNANGALAEEPLLAKHLSEEAAFQCTTCGSCEYQCPVGVEHLPMIIGLRRGAVNTGKWDDDYGNKLFLSLERNGNPLGMSSSEREKFIQRAGLPYYDGTQEYCLWLGCMGAYDPLGRETILALAQVLRYLKVSFGVLKREKCNGDAARRLGNDLAFQQLAESNMDYIRSAKAKKLLSICPHCVRTIREDWQEFGASFEIEHHSVFLARNKDRLPGGSGDGDSIVYHDPCYLGRYQGVYNEPRAVVSHFGKLTEPERARERSFCCGAGGGLAFLGEEKGKRVNHERAEQLVATGARTVGVACPFCTTMFRDALPAVTQTPPELRDIAQLAARRLPAEPASNQTV